MKDLIDGGFEDLSSLTKVRICVVKQICGRGSAIGEERMSSLSATTRIFLLVFAAMVLTSSLALADGFRCQPACMQETLCETADTADDGAPAWPLQDDCCVNSTADCDPIEGGHTLVSTPDIHATSPWCRLDTPGPLLPCPAPASGQAPRPPAQIHIWNSSFLC
jgi:hypothetical protein